MEPTVILVMGAAGCGKTTLARLIAGSRPEAGALRVVVIDADDFHSATNVRRMRRGIPLDDHARKPWLRRLRTAIDRQLAEGHRMVIACSALKARYREILIGGIPRAVIVLDARLAPVDLLVRVRAAIAATT